MLFRSNDRQRIVYHPDYLALCDKTFEECLSILCHQRERLQHDAWLEQAHFICDSPLGVKRVMVDVVLRYESLATDFTALCHELGLPCEALPVVNTSKRGRDCRAYYNEQTRSMVEEFYRSDIEAFGYSF